MLTKQFNVSRSDIWATPANMRPISVLGDMVFNGTLQDQKEYACPPTSPFLSPPYSCNLILFQVIQATKMEARFSILWDSKLPPVQYQVI